MILHVYELYGNFRVFYLKQCLVVKKKIQEMLQKIICLKIWFIVFYAIFVIKKNKIKIILFVYFKRSIKQINKLSLI